jgi:hypothetical protein
MRGYQLEAFRFDHGQWWWQPARTRRTRTRLGALWLRRRLDSAVQWRVRRDPAAL